MEIEGAVQDPHGRVGVVPWAREHVHTCSALRLCCAAFPRYLAELTL